MATRPQPFAPSRVINIDDFRRLAQRRLPQVIFDYLDGGADGEVTLRENCRVFEDVTFRPRQAVEIPNCDLSTQVLGMNLTFPAILAPVGYSRLIHPAGELAASAAAGEAGTIYTLSTISGHRLENVRAASKGAVWYQLYLIGGREAAEAGMDRARRAGFSALVVTIDTPVAGLRERDPRNGMREILGGSLFAKLPFVGQFLYHPGWLAAFLLDGGAPKLENIIIPGQGPMPLIDVTAALAKAVVTWADLTWIRSAWGSGPILIKGVLTGDDAKRALDAGAAAVIVSNHGGRQLDSVSSTLRALPEVAAAVSGRAEVLMDGGIRRGSDIVKAICLGARAVLVGRAYAYAMAAGQAGVARALEILRADVERTLRLLGCPSISQLDASYVDFPAHWRRSAGS